MRTLVNTPRKSYSPHDVGNTISVAGVPTAATGRCCAPSARSIFSTKPFGRRRGTGAPECALEFVPKRSVRRETSRTSPGRRRRRRSRRRKSSRSRSSSRSGLRSPRTPPSTGARPLSATSSRSSASRTPLTSQQRLRTSSALTTPTASTYAPLTRTATTRTNYIPAKTSPATSSAPSSSARAYNCRHLPMRSSTAESPRR